MAEPDEEFLQQLRATFLVEAAEHVQTLSRGIVEVERTAAGPALLGIVDRIFRAAHSLKGAARAVSLPDVETLCQSLEDVLAAWRRNPVPPGQRLTDLLHRAVDGLGQLLDAMRGQPGGRPDIAVLRRELRQSVAAVMATRPEAGAAAASPAAPRTPDSPATPAASPIVPIAAAPQAAAAGVRDSVRVALPRLEAHLLQAEELLVLKLAAGVRATELQELGAWFRQWRKEAQAVLAPARSAETLAMRRFVEWSNDAVRTLEKRISEVTQAARHDSTEAGKVIDTLLDNAKQLLLLPFSTITAPFHRVVRDLCRAQGKEADLLIEGEETEVDKRILEEIKDPLIHMLRNAVDHGVETPQERQRAGKRGRAAISLAVVRVEGARVQIVLRDDGCGISLAGVRAAAVERGQISRQQAAELDDAQALSLVFRPDVSTGPVVTDVSGRGLGLAIVYENVHRLGGEVRAESEAGRGTAFHVTLPMVRSTFRGILCDVAGQHMLVPVMRVERVVRIPLADLHSIEGRESATLKGRVAWMVRVADALGLNVPEAALQAEKRSGYLQAFVVSAGEQLVAFVVDAVLDEHEVLIKPLRKPLVRVRNVAAVAVLGSGRVVPVLHVSDLLRSARQMRPVVRAAASAGPLPLRSVLVAEDSITSRLLLRTILESAGYQVKTAVDGVEAFAMMRTEPFDLLVSDVEMPRMNGFDLTARVRADARLAELPVVLVTALASREDRERGIDAGANAYIVKGKFDQDDLLEAIRRLI